MLRRLAFGLVSLVVALAAGIALWVAIHSSDLPEPDDSDLEVPASEVAADENGLEYLQRAAARAKLTSEESDRVHAILRGEQDDPAWVARVLRANRAALRELERASEAPAIVLPEFPPSTSKFDPRDPYFVAEGHLLTAQMLVTLAALDARERGRVGDQDGALAASTLGLRLTGALARARRVEVVTAIVTQGFERSGLRALGELVRAQPFDARASLRLARKLDSYRLPARTWRAAWSGEYRIAKAAFQEMEKVGPTLRILLDGDLGRSGRVIAALPDRFLWQPNRTLAGTATHYRQYVAAFGEPCRKGNPAFAAPDGRDANGRLLLAMLHGNSLGVALMAVATPNFEKLNTRRCHIDAWISLLQALAALEACRSAEKTLPDSLDALVPRYLDRVPQDAFGGGPLRYDPARGLVSSLGSDFEPATTEGPPSPDDELEPATYVGAAASAR